MARLAALFLALSALSGWGQRQALFVDRSGSMRPYYDQGLMAGIVGPLERAASGAGGLAEYAFSTDVSPQRSFAQIEGTPYGNFTYLDKVIDACERQRVAMAWIVTDNIEDTGEAGNTERFYAKLRGDEVRRVTVFPVLARPGRPGLVVYALLFEGGADAVYEQMLSGFAAGGAGVIQTNPLRMKPVDRETVEVTSRSLAPLTRRGGPKVYETGVPLRESVEVRFRSKFDHIRIVDSTLRVEPAAARFQAGSLLEPERRAISISPDRVRSLGPGDETAQVYLLTVDLGGVRLKNTPAAWWKAAWGKPNEEAEVDTRFVIDVPGENFRLSPKFLNDYSAGTIEQARATGKVYAIERLLSSVNGGRVQIAVDAPLYFKVSYPSWPAFLWLGLLAAGVGAVALLAVFGRRLLPVRKRMWTVTATGRGGREIEARVDGEQVVAGGETVGRIERNRLYAVAPARFEQGDGLELATGTTVQVRTRRSEMDLTFTESDGARARPAAEAAGAGQTPIRRR